MNTQGNPFHSYGIISTALFPGFGGVKRSTIFLLTGLCIGLLMRFGIHSIVAYRFDVGDASYYLAAASNIDKHFVYSGDMSLNPVPEMYRPPFYSFFIATVKLIIGNNPLYIQSIQVIISLLTALLVTHLAAVLAPKSSPWVFGLMMLSPYEAVYTGAVLSESITAFLLIATAYVILIVGGTKRWVISGLLMGLCILTRDIYLLLILFIGGLWIIFGSGDRRSLFIDVMVLLLSASLVVLPWTFRNYKVSERLVPVSDGRLGLSLWMGTWAVSGAFTENDVDGRHVYPSEAFRNDSERVVVENAFAQGGKGGDVTLRSVAIQRIYTDPIAVLKVYIVRLPLLWLGTRFDIFELNKKHFPRGSYLYIAFKGILWGVNFLFVVLGIVGLVLAWRRRSKVLILALPIIYTTLVYFPLNGFENRYSQPVYPFLIVFVAYFLVWVTNRVSLLRRGLHDDN